MTYYVSLSHVSIAVGLIAILVGLPGLFFAEKTRHFQLSLARNFWVGAVLSSIAIIWTVGLLMKVDLGEFSVYRMWMAGAVIVLGVLMIQFLRDFLAARAIGILLLLGAEVLLSAAFPVESKSRLVITILAYIWAIKGMVYVAAPYRLRDGLEIRNKTVTRTRCFSILDIVIGIILIGLGLFVYA